MLRGLRPTYEKAHEVIDPRRGGDRGGASCRTATSPAGSCPTRRSTCSTPRRRGCAIEQDAPPPSRVTARASSSGSAGARADALAARHRRGGHESTTERLGELAERIDEIRPDDVEALDRRVCEAEKVAIDGAAGGARGAARGRRRGPRRRAAAVGGRRAALPLAELQGEAPLVHADVDRDAIAQVVADWTGIPVGQDEGELDRGRCSSSRIDLERADQGSGPRHQGGGRGDPHVARRGAQPRTRRSGCCCSWGRAASARPRRRSRSPTCSTAASGSMITINMSEFQEKHTVSPPHRLAARLRGLRRGRHAHRGGAAAARTRWCCSTSARRPTSR